MARHLETPTRERWLQIVEEHDAEGNVEYRRDGQRRHVEFGVVRLTYEADGLAFARTGAMINASDGGLMVRMDKRIPSAAHVQMEVAIGDDIFALPGRVAHCTQTVGGFKIGVEIRFPDHANARALASGATAGAIGSANRVRNLYHRRKR